MVRHPRHHSRLGFTLTEILVAIGVLLAVVLVTGRIFKVATDVSAVGQATNSVMQEAAAIENRIRKDIASMTREGFLTIHGVSVPNDINIQSWEDDGEQGSKPPLLNPVLSVDARLRCDQMTFFREGVDSSQGWSEATTVSPFPNAQSMHSMVTYGHGIQLPELGAFVPLELGEYNTAAWGHDPLITNENPLVPWRYDNPGLDEDQWLETIDTDYSSGINGLFAQRTPVDNPRYVNGSQPDARQWVLSRQQVLLGDDDNNWPGEASKHQYMQNVPSVMSIFPHDVRQTGSNTAINGGANTDPQVLAYGRIDVAACLMGDVREVLRVSRSPSNSNPYDRTRRRCAFTYYPQGDDDDVFEGYELDVNGDLVPDMEARAVLESSNVFPDIPGGTYLDQRFFMKDVVHWPRAERVPPSQEKVDHALATHTLGSACSSIIIEWTWAEGTGQVDVPSPLHGKQTDRWHGVHYEIGDPLLVNPEEDDPSWVGSDPWIGQRWFGLRDIERGVVPFHEFQMNFPRSVNDHFEGEFSSTTSPYAVNSYAIDNEQTFGGGAAYEEYWATFGLNQQQPDLPIEEWIDSDGDGTTDSAVRVPDPSFSPWPTALRVTMTLHDPDARLEQGVVYQFVIPLPSQAQGFLAGGS
jgi:type II secretory pathway pseudopilin PulG